MPRSANAKLEALAKYIEQLSNGAMNVDGWSTVTAVRSQGSTAGQTDVYFIPPHDFEMKKRRFRSRAEVARALGLLEGKPAPVSRRSGSSVGIHIWAVGRPCSSRERAQSRQKLLKLVTPRINCVPTGWHTTGHRWIGQRVARHFESKVGVPDTLAEITSWIPPSEDDPRALFHCVHGDNDAEDLDSTEVNSSIRLLTKWDRSGISPPVEWDLRNPVLLSLDGSSSIVKDKSLTDLERRSNTSVPTWTRSLIC